ncbi:hypothetical protein [Nocardiopsis sp. LOL_012]|uniref:hypothetical protein n=1 Tax=Nocardiopsis sp. LOL_012 TaxID=3345409 RepID=UPI003A890ED3
MSISGILLIAFIIFIPIAAVLSSRYEKSVHPVKLTGPMTNPAEWLPEALHKAARGGLVSWSPRIEAERDAEGELVSLHCELRSSEGDTILVDVPAFPAGDYTDDPVVATVAIGTYTVASSRGARWFGMPASHVTGRWRRVRRVLKRHARRSAQSV